MEALPRFIQPHRSDAVRLSLSYLLTRNFLLASPQTLVVTVVPGMLLSVAVIGVALDLSAEKVAAGIIAAFVVGSSLRYLGWPMIVRQIEEMHGSVEDYNRPYLERLSSLQRQIEDPVFAAEVREAKAAVTAPEAVGVRFRRLRAFAFFVAMFAVIAVLVMVVERFVHGLAMFPLTILLLAGAQWFIVPKVTRWMHHRRDPEDAEPAPRAHRHDDGGEQESR